MNREPRSMQEYDALVWSFCRECCGRSRTMFDDCKKADCHFFPIKNKPRQQIITFDFTENIAAALFVAEEISRLAATFTVDDVRKTYHSRRGNYGGINWGRLVQRKEWLDRFETCGETKSTNIRSHGDKVKIWRLRNSQAQVAA